MKTYLARLLQVLCVTFLLSQMASASAASFEKVRVGFFEFDGYHMQGRSADGQEVHRSGYGYELLQLLLPYTTWDYEYVGYEKGWSEMLPMLERGEIDLLTSAVKIPEKEAKFDFSERPIGYSSVIMTVKAGSTRYLPHDYAHWNGIRVGVMENNSKNDVFRAFAEEKGFTYQEVVFKNVEELTKALQLGKIDSVVTGSLRHLHNEWLYEQLDVRPFYMIVKKGNAALLKEVNEALGKLELDDPSFIGDLQKKYYSYVNGSENEISFSIEEIEFREESKKANRKFSVLFNPDRFPFSYIEDGEFQGIMRILFDTIEERSGLDLEPIYCRDRQEYQRRLKERNCDVVFDMLFDHSLAEQRGYILTTPYYTAVISRIFKKGTPNTLESCAVVRNSNMAEQVLHHLPSTCRVAYYLSMEDVIDAVKSGHENAGFVFSRTAENAILTDPSGQLVHVPTEDFVLFALGINKDQDRRLVGVLSKTVRTLSEEEIHRALMQNTLSWKKTPSFRDLVVENPLWVSLSLLSLVFVLGASLVGAMTAHRRAQKASTLLEKNSRMWKLLINSLPIQIFAKDATKGYRYVFNNKARSDFFGIEESKMNGMNDYDLLPKELADTRRGADIKLCEAGQGLDEVSLSAKGKDGKRAYLYSVLVPFVHSDGTKLVLGCSIDQTELIKEKKRAEENAEWFQKTLISIGDAILTTDEEGLITLLNPVAEKMLGVTLEKCKGKKHTAFFHLVSYQDGSEVPSPVDRCLNSGEIVSLANHTDLISHNGVRYHIADSAAPIRDASGKISGVILVFRDVTREYDLRDQLQENTVRLKEALALAQQGSAAKGVFLSQMSHEIRTPLNAIIGYLSIAQETRDCPEEIRQYMNKCTNASEHLLSIINDILDISSIESGKLKIAHEDFDFKHLLTGIVSMFYNQGQSKKIRFEMFLNDLTEEWLMGDSLRVNQILLNLLSNAMKFTPAGGKVSLTVKQLGIVQNRVQIMLQVSDTGCGMSEEYKARLFNPFEQQDASTARRFGGTGLGLSITKNLVSMMGGTIDVDSKENEGTTFTVHLPFEQSLKKRKQAEADFSRLRALVADDLEEDRQYIQMILNRCGVKSDVVDSGNAALEQLERRMESRHPYDLCLLDLRLPGRNGIEIAEQIRQKFPQDKLPILLVTAYDVSAVFAQAKAAGVNKIIQKPLFQSTFFDFLMSAYYHLDEKKNNVVAKEALKGLKVLLVEDNEMNMDISLQYLRSSGMVVTSAWNGKEAVDAFVNSAPGTFQVILMDIQMPIMDGYTAAETIRASAHPEAKTIPIVAMTANAFNEDVVKALSCGMNDHISKPVFYDRLFEALSKLTQKEKTTPDGI